MICAIAHAYLEEGESAVTEHVFHVAIEILQDGEKAARTIPCILRASGSFW
jgi:hypothetical protein